jgi:hypothetical protein
MLQQLLLVLALLLLPLLLLYELAHCVRLARRGKRRRAQPAVLCMSLPVRPTIPWVGAIPGKHHRYRRVGHVAQRRGGRQKSSAQTRN